MEVDHHDLSRRAAAPSSAFRGSPPGRRRDARRRRRTPDRQRRRAGLGSAAAREERLHVRQLRGLRLRLEVREHVLADVDREHAPAGAHVARESQREIARPGADVGHALAVRGARARPEPPAASARRPAPGPRARRCRRRSRGGAGGPHGRSGRSAPRPASGRSTSSANKEIGVVVTVCRMSRECMTSGPGRSPPAAERLRLGAQAKRPSSAGPVWCYSHPQPTFDAGLAVRSRRHPGARSGQGERLDEPESLDARGGPRLRLRARMDVRCRPGHSFCSWPCRSSPVGQSPPAWPPPTLRDTGLYADWATKTVAAGNLPFSPQYPLWSDGAAKSRWLHIPKGRFIDGSDPDVWKFPVGTKLWKEFAFGARAETRFIEHTRSGWQFATYVWNEDESEAVLAPEGGIKQSVANPGRHPSRHPVTRRLPRVSRSRARARARVSRRCSCRRTAIRMRRTPSRCPEGAVDLRTLAARGLVRGLPARVTATPPRIVAVDAHRARRARLPSRQLRRLPHGRGRTPLAGLRPQLHAEPRRR